MKKETKYITLIISAISVALFGLISLQIYLLIDSYEQKQQAFDRNVLNAMNQVSQRIEKDEAASKIFSVAMRFPPQPEYDVRNGKGKKFRKVIPKQSGRLPGGASGSFTWIIADSLKHGNGKQMRVEVFQSSGIDTLASIVLKKGHDRPQKRESFSYSYSSDESGVRVNTNMDDSAMVVLRDTTRKRRGEIVSQVVDKLFLVETLPIEQRVNLSRLDSLINQSLAGVGIAMGYSFRVTVGDHDSVKLSNDSMITKQSLGVPFKTRLFPNDVISPKYELALFLPEKSSFVLKEMTMLLVMSLLFIAIIIASFIYSIRVIVLQKRFSVSIMDFINNMTHEFKTPISTIALASEAIAKPDVLKSKPKLLKYNSLIVDENNRMKHQVDKILQMALLEEGEFELKPIDVDMHAVIEHAVLNFSLVAEQRNGKVKSLLNADRFIVKGDAIHLANIIHNLLDNAVKYSSAIPTVTVVTENTGSILVIRVIDNGIGIAKPNLERVFDKYYRVSTGNTHDVKGFGLGLSYVKLVVEAHQGTVSLTSEIGKGTTVEIKLPS